MFWIQLRLWYWNFAPLHFAIKYDNIEIVKLLLAQPNIDVNNQSKGVKTLIYIQFQINCLYGIFSLILCYTINFSS